MSKTINNNFNRTQNIKNKTLKKENNDMDMALHGDDLKKFVEEMENQQFSQDRLEKTLKSIGRGNNDVLEDNYENDVYNKDKKNDAILGNKLKVKVKENIKGSNNFDNVPKEHSSKSKEKEIQEIKPLEDEDLDLERDCVMEDIHDPTSITGNIFDRSSPFKMPSMGMDTVNMNAFKTIPLDNNLSNPKSNFIKNFINKNPYCKQVEPSIPKDTMTSIEMMTSIKNFKTSE